VNKATKGAGGSGRTRKREARSDANVMTDPAAGQVPTPFALPTTMAQPKRTRHWLENQLRKIKKQRKC
jgi:hypothetical protein